MRDWQLEICFLRVNQDVVRVFPIEVISFCLLLIANLVDGCHLLGDLLVKSFPALYLAICFHYHCFLLPQLFYQQASRIVLFKLKFLILIDILLKLF
jgi:hypothetical protein